MQGSNSRPSSLSADLHSVTIAFLHKAEKHPRYSPLSILLLAYDYCNLTVPDEMLSYQGPISVFQPGRSMQDQAQPLPPALNMSMQVQSCSFARLDHQPGQIRHQPAMTSSQGVGRKRIKSEPKAQYIVVPRANGFGSRAKDNSSIADHHIGSSSPYLYIRPKPIQMKSPSVTKVLNCQMDRNVQYGSKKKRQANKSPEKYSFSIPKEHLKTISKDLWVSRHEKISIMDIPKYFDDSRLSNESKLLFLLISDFPLSQSLAQVKEKLLGMYYNCKFGVNFILQTFGTRNASSQKDFKQWVGNIVSSKLSRSRFDYINFTEMEEKEQLSTIIEGVKFKCRQVKHAFDNKKVLELADFFRLTAVSKEIEHVCQQISKLDYARSRLNTMKYVADLYQNVFLSFAKKVFAQIFLFTVCLECKAEHFRTKDLLIRFNNRFKRQLERSTVWQQDQQDKLSRSTVQFCDLIEPYSDQIKCQFSGMIASLKESRKSGPNEDSLNSETFEFVLNSNRK